jgi:hypothetical protein
MTASTKQLVEDGLKARRRGSGPARSSCGRSSIEELAFIHFPDSFDGVDRDKISELFVALFCKTFRVINVPPPTKV